MTDTDRIERTAAEARIPEERVDDDRLAVRSDREPRCRLREGHRVHAVVTKETDASPPVISEIHCASMHCDHHAHPGGVGETVSVDPDEDLRGQEPYEGKDSVIIVSGRLAIVDAVDNPEIGLTEMEVKTFAREVTLPAPP